MTEEFKEKFTGKWKLDRSEHFDEFMSALGVNFIIRKMASMAHPENDIRVDEDGTVVITNNSTFMKNEQRFKIDEEFEEINPNVKKRFKNMPIFKDGKLRVTPTPAEQVDVPFPEYAEREITAAGEMLMTIKIGDVLCKRWFKKQPS